MVAALVGSLGAVNATAGSTANTPAYGQSPTAGNLLILWVDGFGSTVLTTTPAGWTLGPQHASSGPMSSTIYYKVAAGADAAPTVASATPAWTTQLGEFSGCATSSPLDQSATQNDVATPAVATMGAADQAVGELLVSCAAVNYSAAAVATLTDTYTNATSVETNNNAASTTGHYSFAYGITTANASADKDSLAFTSANHQGVTVAIASFLLAGGGPTSQIVGVN